MHFGRFLGRFTAWYQRKFGRAPPRLQAAALPWRRDDDGRLLFMLTTSRRTRRWIVPKGNIDAGEPTENAAQREAWEEVGVRGPVEVQPLGVFDTRKYVRKGIARPLRVVVHLLAVEEMEDDFPESGERERRWMRADEAARAVGVRHLAGLIRRAERLLGETA